MSSVAVPFDHHILQACSQRSVMPDVWALQQALETFQAGYQICMTHAIVQGWCALVPHCPQRDIAMHRLHYLLLKTSQPSDG